MAADPMKALHATTSGVWQERTRPEQASHVRGRKASAHSRAARRVAEYFRTLGLVDAQRVRAISAAIAGETHLEDADAHAAEAVRVAQERFERWSASVFENVTPEPDPLWLRAFLEANPEVFLEEPSLGRQAASEFGDAALGLPPAGAQFAAQKLEPLHAPRWLRGLLPPLCLTAGASLSLLVALGADGLGPLEFVWASLFTFLFGQTAIGFFTALTGFVRSRSETEEIARAEGPLPRSAVIMPIYHESAEHVFAALAAMRQALLGCPGGEAFEIFVLSDSRDPARAAEEERAFRRVTASFQGGNLPIFYRRRARNDRQKAGNLQEFFERWGHRYEYVVVLDADSVMSGETIIELVRRMEGSPRLGLLQAPIALAGGETLFARSLQFAASLCGPVFTRGLARWSGSEGNYYGHNAVIRVRAFLECCSLPVLEGKPPLGGHILSHDFVEAALLCRGGWHVRIAHDLEGSYEGLPPTLSEYVARDRRWCQGNLQHLRVALSSGLRPMSRIHLFLGVASYLAGPAWLLFLVSGLALARGASALYIELGGFFLVSAGVLLVGPRLLGYVATLSKGKLRRAHGGPIRLLLGMLLELVISAAIAPLMMVHHTRIVVSILLGGTVRWGAQRRQAGGQIVETVRSEALTTLLGLGLFGALWHWAPSLLGWLAPLWVPWSLAIPIATLTASTLLGSISRRMGFLSVPSETQPDPVFALAEELCVLTAGDQAARFRDLILDPVLVATHVSRLPKVEGEGSADQLARLAELRHRALRGGPACLSESERQELASDAQSMRWLHREAWRHWPVESWQVARECAQLPPESRSPRSREPLPAHG